MNNSGVNLSASIRADIWTRWEQVAPPRMRAFGQPPIDTCPLDPAARYIWNNQLSAALMPALHTFEVCFRNAVHASLEDAHATASWFDTPNFLQPDEFRQVSKAKAGLVRLGRTVTSDRVVSELMFGFWCSLMNGPYERAVFRPCMARRLARLPAPYRTRSALRSKLEQFRKLRNRVFHHEPIWGYTNLEATEAELWSFAEALYPEFSMLSRDQTNFSNVLHNQFASCKMSLEACIANRIQQGLIQP